MSFKQDVGLKLIYCVGLFYTKLFFILFMKTGPWIEIKSLLWCQEIKYIHYMMKGYTFSKILSVLITCSHSMKFQKIKICPGHVMETRVHSSLQDTALILYSHCNTRRLCVPIGWAG